MIYRHQIRDQRLNLVAYYETDRPIQGTMLCLLGSDARSVHLTAVAIRTACYVSIAVPEKFWIVEDRDITRLLDAGGVIKL